MNKRDKNITITLEFQDIPSPERKGELFMATHGTVIKRVVDKKGIEKYNKDGDIIHEHASFVMTAESIDPRLPDIIRKLAHEALTLKRKENEKNQNQKKESSSTGGIKSPFKGIRKGKGNKGEKDEE